MGCDRGPITADYVPLGEPGPGCASPAQTDDRGPMMLPAPTRPHDPSLDGPTSNATDPKPGSLSAPPIHALRVLCGDQHDPRLLGRPRDHAISLSAAGAWRRIARVCRLALRLGYTRREAPTRTRTLAYERPLHET